VIAAAALASVLDHARLER